MSRLWTLFLGVAVFLLIAGLCTRWHRPVVQQAVVDGAKAQLAAAGFGGIDVSHPGRRDVVLRGAVSDLATRDRVGEAVLAHSLVVSVSNLIDAPESNPTIAGLAGRELLAEESFESSIGALQAPPECRRRLRDLLASNALAFSSGTEGMAATDVIFLEKVGELLFACPGVDVGLRGPSGRVEVVIAALVDLTVERERLVLLDVGPASGVDGRVELVMVEE